MDEFPPWEISYMKNAQKHIEEHGESEIGELFKAKLERWKDVEINIGVTGNCGVGKSSFINAIRGYKNDDEGAAKAGVVETTREAAVYPLPTNEKIKFWDLPGTGTPNYSEFEKYWEKVGLEKFDTFLILTAIRFTDNDLLLAKKVKSIKKPFFFARTKIDGDIYSEKMLKRKFNKEDVKAMLNTIRENCLVNLKGLVAGDKDVFLISNIETDKWDFDRLRQAILDGLSQRQKESLSLSLDFLPSRSKDLLKRKTEILRGRIWMVASASAAAAVIPVPGLSIAVDLGLLKKEMNFYKSQLGLPEKNSDEFRSLTPKIQEKIGRFFVTSAVDIAKLIAVYSASSSVEEFSRFIPLVGIFIAGSISFSSTYYFLHHCLKEMEETAMTFLDETS